MLNYKMGRKIFLNILFFKNKRKSPTLGKDENSQKSVTFFVFSF